MIHCPSCDAPVDVEVEDLDEGDEVSCDECGATLNVVALDPLELAAAGDDEEEEEDDDFDFDTEDGEDEDDDEDED